MAYDPNRQHKIQTAEESLHWISFNLKQLNATLKEVVAQFQANSPVTSYMPPKAPERRYNEPPRAYKEDRQEDIPF